MAHIKVCECGEEFDLYSKEKKVSGGLAIHCPECSEESTTKYLGVQASDGKTAQASILKFDNDKDKENYLAFWKSASGYAKGKVCQLSQHAKTQPHVKFETIVAHEATNHKGKLT